MAGDGGGNPRGDSHSKALAAFSRSPLMSATFVHLSEPLAASQFKERTSAPSLRYRDSARKGGDKIILFTSEAEVLVLSCCHEYRDLDDG